MTRAALEQMTRALAPGTPVLIAGPTASGKSACALQIAAEHGGVIVNADASQVYDCWQALTARPTAKDQAAARHALYGHVSEDAPYSVGHWLQEIRRLMAGPDRLIITGGTGLYFKALTEGLVDIPATPSEVRAEADAMTLPALIASLDALTASSIDLDNRARVQRAWEVFQSTGRGLSEWQADTPDPLMPLSSTLPIILDVDRDWLNARIARRFDMMLEAGALHEAERLLPRYDPKRPAHRAIGAPELIAHLRGEISLDAAREAAVVATRQYAKRQRTWARGRMPAWRALRLP